MDINKHAIKLIKDKQLFYRSIYSLSLVKLKTFKTYIKTNLANRFIWSFKFTTNASIFFIYRLNNNFYLCINYQSLNNLIIKN